MAEQEALVRQSPRVLPEDFEVLYHIAEEVEQIGREDEERRRRLDAMEQGND